MRCCQRNRTLSHVSQELQDSFFMFRNMISCTVQDSKFCWRISQVPVLNSVAQWLRCCATNRKVAGSIPAGVSGFFIDIKSFRSQYGSGVDSASNINEYQAYFLGVKAAGA